MEKETQLYEMSFILDTADEEKAAEFVNSLKSLIVDNRGIIIADAETKIHNFAYPINKKNSGWFGWTRFLIDEGALSVIKKFLSTREDLMRFLIIKIERETLHQKPAKERKIQKPAAEKQVNIEEIDKKLEEILGES